MKNLKYIKIENRGKVDNDILLSKTEDFIRKLFFEIDNGRFLIFNPKMIYVLKETELNENEELGFRFTLLFDIFKGRVIIAKIKDKDSVNIYFYKRHPIKGRFEYNLYNTKLNIPYNKINNQFNFIITGENLEIKTGNIYLLKNGIVCIIKKLYSNHKIGVIYDECSEEVEDYIQIEDIDKQIKNK